MDTVFVPEMRKTVIKPSGENRGPSICNYSTMPLFHVGFLGLLDSNRCNFVACFLVHTRSDFWTYPWCSPAAWALSEFGYAGAFSEWLVEFNDDHLQDLDLSFFLFLVLNPHSYRT